MPITLSKAKYLLTVSYLVWIGAELRSTEKTRRELGLMMIDDIFAADRKFRIPEGGYLNIYESVLEYDRLIQDNDFTWLHRLMAVDVTTRRRRPNVSQLDRLRFVDAWLRLNGRRPEDTFCWLA